jgi:hypothetical protein
MLPLMAHAATADAYWKDDHKTLVYNSKEYTGGSGRNASFTTVVDSTHHCLARVDFGGDYTTATSATAYTQNWIAGRENHCQWSSGTTISVDPAANSTSGSTSGGGSGSDNSGGQVATEDPCDASGDPLSWFICPVINMINGAIIKMQAIIDNLLEFDVATVFDRSKDSGQAYYAAWNSFRLVGIAVVVIAGLVMVITQALGLEVFDAYTVKRVVPRLFIAAIGISLSWYLLQFLANVTNDVGLAVRNMIYWPFRNLGNGDTGLTSASGFLAGDLLVGGVLFTLGIAGTLSLVVTAGLAALVAFLVLILRQLVLILLILLAPLAIALYVLPNTQKAYQLWWDSISKGFLMFPIITAFIATGRVFSVVAANAGGNGIHHAINEVISLIAFFLPYFALPFTFRLAGGAIGTLAGLTNDRSRGAFDRLKNFRANQAAQGWERKKNNNMFRGGNEGNFRGKINRGVANTLNAPAAISESGATLSPHKWRTSVNAFRATREFDRAMEGIEKSAAMRVVAPDDTLLNAGLQGGESDVRRYLQSKAGGSQTGRQLDQNVAHVMAAKRDMGDDAFRIAAGVALAGTKTGYGGEYDENGNLVGKTANEQMLGQIADIAGGDAAVGARMYAAARGQAGRAGRIDLAGHGFGMGVGQLFNEIARRERKAVSEGQPAGVAVNDQLNIDTFLNNDAVTIGRSDSRAVRNIMDSVNRRVVELSNQVNDPAVSADVKVNSREEIGRLTAGLENMRDQGFYFAPQRITNVVRTMDRTAAERNAVHDAVISAGSRSPTTNPNAAGLPTRSAPEAEAYLEQRPDGVGGRRGGQISPDDPRNQQREE